MLGMGLRVTSRPGTVAVEEPEVSVREPSRNLELRKGGM
jgi:hypothetical protein